MKLGKISILCPKCGLDRGKEVCGIGTACPRCGFTPQSLLSKPKREDSSGLESSGGNAVKNKEGNFEAKK